MKDFLVFLKHIRDSIKDIEDFTKEVSKEEFMKDKKVQSAVVRQIEVIGEAVKNLPLDFKKKNPKIEWRVISGMRDKLIHHYFGVDIEKVWGVVRLEIPKLKKEINILLKRENKS
jgi:uncharacterized protein with HEPN domain